MLTARLDLGRDRSKSTLAHLRGCQKRVSIQKGTIYSEPMSRSAHCVKTTTAGPRTQIPARGSLMLTETHIHILPTDHESKAERLALAKGAQKQSVRLIGKSLLNASLIMNYIHILYRVGKMCASHHSIRCLLLVWCNSGYTHTPA